jgi:antirestriction protein ArdC
MPDENGSTPKRDFRQEVTDNIIRMLEQGTAPWQKPWEAGKLEMPNNPTTQNPYRGGNAIHLMSVGTMRGYEDPRWLTYKQAAEQGWQVRKGEKGTQIEYWEFPDGSRNSKPRTGSAGNSEESAKADDERRIIHRVYTVFNAQQIEGIPSHESKQHPEFEVVEAGENILRNSGAEIKHDQNDRAFYSRRTDSIHLPPQTAFKTAGDYYGTALHELAHWTGHPSRLNRSTLNESYRFGDSNYAQEELRAELASVFLAAGRGIPHDPEQHAAYVGSWINALRNDKNEIFRAAKDANRAADFLLALELEKGIAEEQLATEPPETTIAARQNALSAFERETEDLERAEVAVKDSAIDTVAEQAFEPANPPRFKPGDKIVAFEPYHYGGKPKKEPETPGVVQSVYADGQYVSYMRLDGKGSLRENGNKAVDDRGLRLANSADLKQFEKQFAQLESKFRETSRHTAQYEPETGTVNIHDKHSVTDRRTPVGDFAARSARAGKQVQSLRNSFSEAQTISKQSMGDSAKTYAAQTDSGIYRGEIIGQTELHVVQRLNGESAVAHMKHILSRIPERGENVLVKYSKDGARVNDVQARSRSKELAR